MIEKPKVELNESNLLHGFMSEFGMSLGNSMGGDVNKDDNPST